MSVNAAPATKYRWLLIITIFVAFTFRLWGIQRDLPYSPAVDESQRVKTAINMVAQRDLNPGYFNHPSSTVIYPLVAIFHFWNISFYGGKFLHTASIDTFYADLHEYYLLGRLLSVGFAVLSVPLLYQLGRKTFNRAVGIIGAAWWVLIPEVAYYTQIVRDDIAAAFFGLLSLWLCLKWYSHPKLKFQIFAGASIGLSIATRYFMVALIPVLIAVDALILWEKKAFNLQKNKRLWISLGIGLAGIPIAFALSTPYFFLDFGEALSDLSGETRTTHLGADGLSPAGNLLWYLKSGIPGYFTTILNILIAAGIVLVVYNRKAKPLLLLGFMAFFLLEISLHPLHWSRWLIQIVPVLTLFAAAALTSLVNQISAWFKWKPAVPCVVLVIAVCLLSAPFFFQLVEEGKRLSHPSTNLQAREWVFQNLPEGSKIAQDAYSAYLVNGVKFVVDEAPSLAAAGYSLKEVQRRDYRYIVLRYDLYNGYLTRPNKYQAELVLYKDLFNNGVLLKEFTPSTSQRGPTIRIYEFKNDDSFNE